MIEIQQPKDTEAERALLSAFLTDPRQVGNVCAERRVTTEDFFTPAHATIYGALYRMWADGEAIDFVTLGDSLQKTGDLSSIGGRSYIVETSNYAPVPSMAGNYAEILREKTLLRRLWRVCSQFSTQALQNPPSAPDLLIAAQNALAGICANTSGEPRTFQSRLHEALDSIERGDDATPDISSGLAGLDKLLKMRNGNFIVIAGEAKSGKTALAGTILTNAATRQAKRCVAFSLEMTSVEMIKRMISCAGRVNVSMIGRQPTEYDLQGVQRGATALDSKDIEIEDDCYDLGAIVARLRQLHAKRPVNLVVLDYLQLVEFSTGRKGETRQEIVAQISRTCKRLAGELQCVFLGLSQLNDDGKLRESRAIGQDANAIVAVQKDEDGGRTIRVVAQRSGESGVDAQDVQWLPQYTKFEDK